MKTEDIVREITRRCWGFGVSVLLAPEATVDCDGSWTAGWFDGDDKKLVVAVGCEEQKWLGVLLHEYCHVTQWVEQTPTWVAADNAENISDWLAGQRIRNARKAVALARDMEAECERRTIRLIREFEAPLDLDRYIRGANSYCHFYNVIAEKRKWYAEGRGPYNVTEVLAVSNPTFDRDFNNTPKALRAALLTCI